METEKVISIIEEETKALLAHMGIVADVEVRENEEGYSISITAEDSALLIGRHGNTLASFEYILSFIIARKIGEYKRVIVEVGGYRKEREEYLKSLAERLREEVVSSGTEKTIQGLKPWERRLIHILFKDDSEVSTESQGEEKERVLVIKKK